MFPRLSHRWNRTPEQELTACVLAEAEATARWLGFGWRPAPDAPSDFRSLQRAYRRSRRSGQPLPVSEAHTDSTVYRDRSANLAFRFWHDITHVRLKRGFSSFDEAAVTMAQLELLKARGLSVDALALFLNDTYGQNIVGTCTGSFPEDQAAFARAGLDLGLDPAVRQHVRAWAGQLTRPEQEPTPLGRHRLNSFLRSVRNGGLTGR